MYQKEQYLQTLRLVPDSVIRKTSTHTLDLYDPNRCICGWVLREAIATMKDVPVARIDVRDKDVPVPTQCSRIFGGTVEEWAAIYNGVMDARKAPVIEAAFMQRVNETAWNRW